MRTIHAYRMHSPKEPLVKSEVEPAPLSSKQALVQVNGSGVCHTDVGFLFGGVRTGHPPPLTLGHEISGVIVEAGDGAKNLVGQSVVVPAVLPCGDCALCRAGAASICRKQIFFGCDVDGGFASHLVAPTEDLCIVPKDRLDRSGLDLASLSVIADAVSTPYQAIVRSGLEAGDLAVFVGVGGVGGFGAQIASAMGAKVVVIDVDQARLEALSGFGPSLFLSATEEPKAIKKKIGAFAEAEGLSPYQWKIFETSGHAKGQELAFSLLTFGSTMMVVGYTLEKVTLRLSNLMALDARAQGNWGCLPEHYPKVLDLVLDGKVKLEPFIEKRPMSRINETFEDIEAGRLKKRPVLIPDFD